MKKDIKSILRLCARRRWALFFLNLVAGLFAAPYMYWSAILMRVVLRAAHGEPVLPWLAAVEALGGLPLLMLAALGAGGCLSALRKLLRGEDGFLPGEVFRGMGRCAATSLPAGALLALSVGIYRVGILNLHVLMPSGALRASASAFLLLQLTAALPLCVLALTREDALQRRPLRAFAAAGRFYAREPVRVLGLLAATALPLLLFFVWQPPVLTLLGFLLVVLCGLVPAMIAWQTLDVRRQTLGARSGRRGLLPLAMAIFFALDALILWFTPVSQGQLSATLGDALAFINRFYADSGTLLRDMLAAGSVWPLLLMALLGSACCVMAAFACACYRFRLRGLVFAAAVLLQILPMLASYSSLERLLRNLELPLTGTLLGLAWALSYILAALLLYRRFARMLPGLQKNRDTYPGARLFFYYALPRAPLQTLALIALVTLGCWDDALAPFWYMRSLGAFSLAASVWEQLAGWSELAVYLVIFLAMLGILLLILKLRSSQPASRSPRPSAD